MDSILGRTILGYKVKEKIGTGGFGDVYRVERSNIVGNVTRALKVITLPKENQYVEILNSMGGDSQKADKYFKQELDRVLNEIRVFSLISEKDNHNIVSYYENDVEKSGKYTYKIYILMEMLTPLDQWLAMNNLTAEQGIDIGLGVAKALKICHENSIMHRDIKINNIFVSKDGKFKLGDFGVSKRLDNLTRANTIKGTPHYIAPEVYIGNERYNNSVDIYSLGILLYYLFNKSRFPFYPNYPAEYTKGDEDKAFYRRMNYEIPQNPVNAPESIAAIILKAISGPENRYTRAQDFIDDLQAAKAGLSEEQLKEKIGFPPLKIAQDNRVNLKERQLISNLYGSNSKSISFGQYSMDITAKETISHNKNKKKQICAVLVLTVILILCAGLAIWKNGNNSQEAAVTENESTNRITVETVGATKTTKTIRETESKEKNKVTERTTTENLQTSKSIDSNIKPTSSISKGKEAATKPASTKKAVGNNSQKKIDFTEVVDDNSTKKTPSKKNSSKEFEFNNVVE